MGALAIDERRGNRWGWAVDYETLAAAREAALRECGSGCSAVLTSSRCGAYADSTAEACVESCESGAGACQAALAECSPRGGGSGCTLRVRGCNGPAVEEALGLDHAARRQIQQGLQSAGFGPGERTVYSVRGHRQRFGRPTRARRLPAFPSPGCTMLRWGRSIGVHPTAEM